MLTPKENYLIAAKGGKPEWVPVFGEDANIVPPFIWDPDPETKVDWLNTTWLFEDDSMAPMPDTRKPAMTSITQWREVVQWPDLASIDWDAKSKEFFEGDMYDPDKVNIAMANTAGIFLVPINMMGWVEGMVDMMEEPEEYKSFVDAITDFIIEYIGYLGTYFKPDIIYSGDDVAAANGPFVSQDVFDEIFKDNFARIADAIHAQGALAEFHCCGNCQWVIDKQIECGYDIAQLPVPNEALMASREKYGNRLVITGGWERHGPAGAEGAPEDLVRQSVRDAIDKWGADGALIFWDGGIILNSEYNKKKMGWLMDELHTYGREVYQS